MAQCPGGVRREAAVRFPFHEGCGQNWAGSSNLRGVRRSKGMNSRLCLVLYRSLSLSLSLYLFVSHTLSFLSSFSCLSLSFFLRVFLCIYFSQYFSVSLCLLICLCESLYSSLCVLALPIIGLVVSASDCSARQMQNRITTAEFILFYSL